MSKQNLIAGYFTTPLTAKRKRTQDESRTAPNTEPIDVAVTTPPANTTETAANESVQGYNRIRQKWMKTSI